jgi:hypothetical protein
VITGVAFGAGRYDQDLTIDSNGNVYVVDASTHVIRTFTIGTAVDIAPVVDESRPTISSWSTSSSPSKSRTVTITANFNERINWGKQTVSASGTATCGSPYPKATAGTSIKFTIVCTTDGTVSMNVNGNGLINSYPHMNNIISDDAGNRWNSPSTTSSSSITIDTSAPIGTVTTQTKGSTGSVNVQSTETGTAYLVHSSVSVLDVASITNAADSSWNSVQISTINTNFAIAVTGLVDGTYKVYTVDAAGNVSGASSGTVTIDVTSPTVSISRNGSNSLGIGETDVLTFTLSETATNFAVGDVTLSGGSLSGFSGSGVLYSATFTPTPGSSGSASISVSSGVFTDSVGNGNTASTTFAVAYDTVPTTTTTTTTTTTSTMPPTTVATTTVPPTTVAPAAVTTTTVATPTATTIAKTPYKDWTISVSPTSVTPAGKFTLEVSVTCPNKMSNGFMYGNPTGTPLFKFDIENSSGTSVGGGETWKGTQVLSNNNYTVTWTREIGAPTTEGSYSVLVYSAGAAADYIYCKMQMNGRTDGPKTSLGVALATTTTSITSTTATTITTSTTTTIPPLPVTPEVLERKDPTQPIGLVDGKPVAIEVVESPTSLEVSAGGIVATVGGLSSGRNPLTLTADGEIRVTNNEKVQVVLTGLLPVSRVDVWLYSRDGRDQKYLGYFNTSGSGALSEDIQIPSGRMSGSADILITARNAKDEKVSVGIPMQIVQVVTSNGSTTSIAAGLLFAIGSIFIFFILRRDREEEEEILLGD